MCCRRARCKRHQARDDAKQKFVPPAAKVAIQSLSPFNTSWTRCTAIESRCNPARPRSSHSAFEVRLGNESSFRIGTLIGYPKNGVANYATHCDRCFAGAPVKIRGAPRRQAGSRACPTHYVCRSVRLALSGAAAVTRAALWLPSPPTLQAGLCAARTGPRRLLGRHLCRALPLEQLQ